MQKNGSFMKGKKNMESIGNKNTMTDADREWQKIIDCEVCRNCMFYKQRTWNKASRCKIRKRRVAAYQKACHDFDQLLNNFIVDLSSL